MTLTSSLSNVSATPAEPTRTLDDAAYAVQFKEREREREREREGERESFLIISINTDVERHREQKNILALSDTNEMTLL